MFAMTWWVAALGAAIIQGIHYPLVDKALEHLSAYTILLITISPLILIYPFFHAQVIKDIAVFYTLTFGTQVSILSVGITSTLTAFLIYAAISASNASLASLIEITYPIFVVGFAYIILKENHLSLSVIIGGILILIGACIIIFGAD